MHNRTHPPRPASLNWRAIAALSASLLWSGCTDTPTVTAPPQTTFPIHVDNTVFQLQLAINPAEKQRGLMERTDLPADHGMLFVFPTAGKRSFWMHNTPLPLDIAYADSSGVIREIYPLIPYNLNSVESQRDDIAIALEVNRGILRQHSIRPGSRINLDDLRQALRSRGQSPANFAIGEG